MTNITRRAALKLGVTGLFGSVSGIFGHRAVASLPTGDDGIQRSERQKLADIASSFMDKFDVPGLSVAIARHGRIVYREPFGFADRDRGEKLSSDHLFRIASVSKTLTAVAISRLSSPASFAFTIVLLERRKTSKRETLYIGDQYSAQTTARLLTDSISRKSRLMIF
jgi:hypothetical protein